MEPVPILCIMWQIFSMNRVNVMLDLKRKKKILTTLLGSTNVFISNWNHNTQIQLYKRNANQVLFFSCSQTNIIIFVLTLYPHISGILHNSHDLEVLFTKNTQAARPTRSKCAAEAQWGNNLSSFQCCSMSMSHSRGTANLQPPSPHWWSCCIARLLCSLLCNKRKGQDLVQQLYLVEKNNNKKTPTRLKPIK